MMARLKLRDYETNWLRRIRASSSQRLLIVGPTGAGKTVIACQLIIDALDRGERVLFVVHRRELVKQAVDRLHASGVEPGSIGVVMGNVVAAERELLVANDHAPIQVASIQALARRDALPPASLMIIDEAHHARAASYLALLEAYADATVYGLTATPYRLDGRPLGELFDAMVQCAPPSELIEAGYLQKPLVYTVPLEQRPDLRHVRRTTDGEYDRRELAEAVNRKELVGSIVDHWHKYAEGRPTVCYAVNIEHGKHIARCFTDRGVRAMLLHAKTPTHERVELLSLLVSGDLAVLVNCMVLTEGWDCPEAKLAVVARPTMSTGLWMQMTGRITRPVHGCEQPIVLDHAGNALVHGLPLEDVTFSLDATLPRRRRHGVMPEKTCPECGNAVPFSVRACEFCGYEWWELKLVPEEHAGELVPMRGAQVICRWHACPTPHLPVVSHDGPVKTAMHARCRAAAALEKRRCLYERCLTPDRPVSYTSFHYKGSRMHRACSALSRGHRAYAPKRRCAYEHCPTPAVLIPLKAQHEGLTPAMHAACASAAAQAARRCQYEHCPTPEKLLTKRRTEMHRACASARARHRTSLCERCGNPLELAEGSQARLHEGCRKQASHGSRARYVKGCRCVECRKANVAYQREYARTRTAQAAPGSTVHGV